MTLRIKQSPSGPAVSVPDAGGAALSTTAPAPVSTANVGIGTTAARADHVHGIAPPEFHGAPLSWDWYNGVWRGQPEFDLAYLIPSSGTLEVSQFVGWVPTHYRPQGIYFEAPENVLGSFAIGLEGVDDIFRVVAWNGVPRMGFFGNQPMERPVIEGTTLEEKFASLLQAGALLGLWVDGTYSDGG